MVVYCQWWVAGWWWSGGLVVWSAMRVELGGTGVEGTSQTVHAQNSTNDSRFHCALLFVAAEFAFLRRIFLRSRQVDG